MNKKWNKSYEKYCYSLEKSCIYCTPRMEIVSSVSKEITSAEPSQSQV